MLAALLSLIGEKLVLDDTLSSFNRTDNLSLSGGKSDMPKISKPKKLPSDKLKNRSFGSWLKMLFGILIKSFSALLPRTLTLLTASAFFKPLITFSLPYFSIYWEKLIKSGAISLFKSAAASVPGAAKETVLKLNTITKQTINITAFLIFIFFPFLVINR